MADARDRRVIAESYRDARDGSDAAPMRRYQNEEAARVEPERLPAIDEVVDAVTRQLRSLHLD